MREQHCIAGVVTKCQVDGTQCLLAADSMDELRIVFERLLGPGVEFDPARCHKAAVVSLTRLDGEVGPSLWEVRPEVGVDRQT